MDYLEIDSLVVENLSNSLIDVYTGIHIEDIRLNHIDINRFNSEEYAPRVLKFTRKNVVTAGKIKVHDLRGTIQGGRFLSVGSDSGYGKMLIGTLELSDVKLKGSGGIIFYSGSPVIDSLVVRNSEFSNFKYFVAASPRQSRRTTSSVIFPFLWIQGSSFRNMENWIDIDKNNTARGGNFEITGSEFFNIKNIIGARKLNVDRLRFEGNSIRRGASGAIRFFRSEEFGEKILQVKERLN